MSDHNELVKAHMVKGSPKDYVIKEDIKISDLDSFIYQLLRRERGSLASPDGMGGLDDETVRNFADSFMEAILEMCNEHGIYLKYIDNSDCCEKDGKLIIALRQQIFEMENSIKKYEDYLKRCKKLFASIDKLIEDAEVDHERPMA